MSRLRITNATVVLPDETARTDIAVENGRIAAIGPAASQSAATAPEEVVDAAGLHLIPGVIDSHVHFREPGLTHKEDLHTASQACAKGGVTSFVEMPNTVPHAVDQQRIDQKLRLAAKRSLVNYGFYIGATPTNVEELANAQRVAGIKVFIGSSTGDLLVDQQDDLERIFAETTLPICAHCEDEATVRRNYEALAERQFPGGYADHSRVRDREAAVIATRRALDLATRHNHRFHVLHVSTADELPLIRAARGIVTGEVCFHHLFFSTDDYQRLGSLVQMNPSIKDRSDNDALFGALLDGTLQQAVTDHAPHTLEEKAKPYPSSPSGLPAVENALALMLDRVNAGAFTLEQVVDWMCTAPALTWDIVDRGQIVEGYAADLVLVDMNRTAEVRNEDQLTKCGWSPWHGKTLTGWPVRTFVNGVTVFAEGRPNTAARGEALDYDHDRGGYWAHRPIG